MKNAVTCFLIFLVSFAYCYETMEYFSKVIGDSSVALVEDINCGENSESESEGSKGKSEKLDFSDDTYLGNKYHNTLLFDYTETGNRGSKQNNAFSSSDHSREIYSPPEML